LWFLFCDHETVFIIHKFVILSNYVIWGSGVSVFRLISNRIITLMPLPWQDQLR
jgi:hypothetical protein